MDYAIIKSGEDDLLTMIKLRDWESYQWNSFHTLKSKEDDDIVWFETMDEAVEFMEERFAHEHINPKHLKGFTSLDDKYYIT